MYSKINLHVFYLQDSNIIYIYVFLTVSLLLLKFYILKNNFFCTKYVRKKLRSSLSKMGVSYLFKFCYTSFHKLKSFSDLCLLLSLDLSYTTVCVNVTDHVC